MNYFYSKINYYFISNNLISTVTILLNYVFNTAITLNCYSA